MFGFDTVTVSIRIWYQKIVLDSFDTIGIMSTHF
ncbi:Uncharacterised protein [Klebsiella grimontii]|nr:Uncharacterised protein [Klebsiella grimontii]